jgi:hypothetical protein
MPSQYFLTNARDILIATCVAASAHASAATFGVDLASMHIPRAPFENNANPGAYVLTDSGVLFGAYHNTWRRTSLMLGYDLKLGPVDLLIGAVTGYQRHTRFVPCDAGSPYTRCWINEGWSRGAVSPMLAPSIALPAVLGLTPRLSLIPSPRCQVVHLSIERRFE